MNETNKQTDSIFRKVRAQKNKRFMDKLLAEESRIQSRRDKQWAFSRGLVAQRLKHQLIEQREEEVRERSGYSKPCMLVKLTGSGFLQSDSLGCPS